MSRDEWTTGLHVHPWLNTESTQPQKLLSTLREIPSTSPPPRPRLLGEQGEGPKRYPAWLSGGCLLPAAWRRRTRGWGCGDWLPSFQTSKGKTPNTHPNKQMWYLDLSCLRAPQRNFFHFGCFLLSTFLLGAQEWSAPFSGFLFAPPPPTRNQPLFLSYGPIPSPSLKGFVPAFILTLCVTAISSSLLDHRRTGIFKTFISEPLLDPVISPGTTPSLILRRVV